MRLWATIVVVGFALAAYTHFTRPRSSHNHNAQWLMEVDRAQR